MVEVALADKLALHPEEAAAISGLGVKLIRTLCHTDATFPAFSKGRHVLIPRRELMDWLKRQAELKVGMPEKIIAKRRTR